jgi:hypothetical protein
LHPHFVVMISCHRWKKTHQCQLKFLMIILETCNTWNQGIQGYYCITLKKLSLMSFHPWKTLSSLCYLGFFCIIHKWIDIQGVFILKHWNMKPQDVKLLAPTCVAKLMTMYIVYLKTNMRTNACKTSSIKRTLVLHNLDPNVPNCCL